MKDVVISILTDEDARSSDAVESVLLSQATAAPWSSEEL